MNINKAFLKRYQFEDYRQFACAFGDWAYTKDFTYKDHVYDPGEGAIFSRFLQEFIRDMEEEAT